MATNSEPINPFGENLEGPIPPVDPADLRSVWEMQRELQARVSGGVLLDNEFFKRACSPGANGEAVWFRTAMLGMLEMLGMLAPWMHDGVPTDAVFNVAATFPMKGMPIGVPQEELPFDVQEFFSQVAKS